MSKYIPVEPEKWAEMVKALALVKEMDKTINASQAECRRLKAEVERLYRHGDLMLKFAAANMPYPAYATMAKDWLAAKEGKPSV